MSSILADIRYAFRGLLSRPAFSIVAILTLALGIGANTAIFSVVNGVVLQPLQYPDPGRLMYITSQFEGMFDQFWVSAPEFVEFREQNKAFESVGAYTVGAANLGTEIPRRPVTATVSHDLMTALGVQPLRGRLFAREDMLPKTEEVAILSYELWRNAFGENPATVGSLIDVGGLRTRIVGIMPPGYDVHDEKIELWRPLRIDPANPGNRGGHFLYLVGRLKPGLTIEQARADLEALLGRWPSLAPANRHAPNQTTHRYRIDPLKDDMVGEVKQAVWVLQGAVAFVLLIACANLANLLLARAESRQREFAVRTAMGASRRRMLQQFITEGIVLSVIGGALGVWLATLGVQALLAANPDSIPRAGEITVDLAVLGFTLVLAIVTGVFFGVAPLFHLSQRSMNISLREGGSRTTAGTAKARMRAALVVAEVALAVVLVVGAGLLLRSFWNLMQVDAGFSRENLTTFQLSLPQSQYPEPARRVAFYRGLIDKIRAVSGVRAAAAMTGLPPSRDVNANDTEFVGVPTPPAGPIHNVDYYQTVTAGYLAAMGIPVVEGRGFAEADAASTGGVVLVNETLAKRFYPGQSPLGRIVKPSMTGEPAMTIVGVVKDVKQRGLGEETGTELYLLVDQLPTVAKSAPGTLHVVVRSSTTVRNDRARPAANRPLHGCAVAGCEPPSDDGGVCRIDGAAEISDDAARGVCRIGAAARGDRHLRRLVLSRQRAASGNRHTHGPWRRARHAVGHGDAARSHARPRRSASGPGGRDRSDTVDADAAVQCPSRRSRDDGRGGGGDCRRGAGCLLRAGPPGDARRSADRAEGGMKRTSLTRDWRLGIRMLPEVRKT